MLNMCKGDAEMNTRNALVVRRNRCDSPRSLLTRPAPPSIMVMEQLVNTLTRMNEKIDALALRQPQLPELRPSRSIQVDVRPVVRENESLLPQAETKKTRYKVRRSALLDMFE